MINPIVFRRMNKGWRVDEFIPYDISFYKELEEQCSKSFFHPVQIRRMFSSEQEKSYWLEKQAQEEYQDYLHEVNEADETYSLAKNDFGSGRLKQAFYVETDTFLSCMHVFINQHAIMQGVFKYDGLSGNSYNGVEYDEIVFCEGYLGFDNPWFSDLPLGQTKGETLTVKAHSLPDNISLNRKCFMLPLGDHTYKIGSTYEWETTDLSITENGKKALLEKLSYLTDEEVVVIDQEAGIRPTTPDRRPLIGTHHTYEHLHLFNGLGTKGYLIAPLLAKEFCDYLLEKKELDPEMNLERFYK